METQTLLAIFELKLYGKPIEGIQLDAEKLGARLKEWVERYKASPQLAYVYAYVYKGGHYILPEPLAYIVPGSGQTVEFGDHHEKWLPAGKYQTWQVDPTDPALQFDVQTGTFGDLLLEPEELAADTAGGATLIRGADGRVYLIQPGLEAFEVLDEDAKSELLLAEGMDRPDLSVRSLSASAVMASRAVMAFRAVMTAPHRIK